MTATIALVDDDRNILTSVSIALQTEGFLTRVYSDGESALKALIERESARRLARLGGGDPKAKAPPRRRPG